MYTSIACALCLLAIAILLRVLWKYWIASFNLNFFPSAPTVPLFGSSLYLETKPGLYYDQLVKYTHTLGSSFCVWFTLKPIIFSSSVKYSEAILKSQKNTSKSWLYNFLTAWLHTGLLTSAGVKWKFRRRVLSPSFHFFILNDFVNIFDEQANILVKKLNELCNSGKDVDVQPLVSLATLSVISETSMGVKINAQECFNSEYVKSIFTLNEEITHRIKYPWLWNNFVYKNFFASGRRFYKALNVAHTYTQDVINQRIFSRIQNGSTNSDKKKRFFLDLLLDIYEKGDIDLHGIKEEVDTFMFAGHDTTSAVISWTLWELSRNKAKQTKLQEAIDEAESKGGEILEKALSCKYLEYVLKEGLRLHPSVSAFGRTIEEDTVIDNHKFLKGTEIFIFTLMLHRNPEYWEKPDDFIPERFEDESFLKRNPYCYVPFSAGPRNCIGQKFAMNEEKVFLYHIMLNYLLSPSLISPIPTLDLTHKSENGLWMKFERR